MAQAKHAPWEFKSTDNVNIKIAAVVFDKGLCP